MANQTLLAFALLAHLALSAPLLPRSPVARIEWAAAGPDSYDSATGGGRWVSRTAEVINGNHVCGDVVSMLAKIDMAAGFKGTQTVHFMPTFEGLGDDAVVGAVLNVDDSETTLHEGHMPSVGLEKKSGEFVVSVIGLKESEHVVVRVDATVNCGEAVPANGLGMQSRIVEAQVQAPGARKTILSEKTVSQAIVAFELKDLEKKVTPESIKALYRMQLGEQIRTGSKKDGSKDGSKKDGSKKDGSKDGSKKDGSKDKSGKDKGTCGCRLMPSGGKCLDFLGPIAGTDDFFKCDPRQCGPSWRCVDSGATEKCTVKHVDSTRLNFMYFSGDHGVCNQLPQVRVLVKPVDSSKEDGSKEKSKKDRSEDKSKKDGSKDKSKKDGSKDKSKKDGTNDKSKKDKKDKKDKK